MMLLMKTVFLLTTVLCSCLCSEVAEVTVAGEVLTYYAIPHTWHQANGLCMQNGGYLVTVDTTSIFDAVIGLAEQKKQFFEYWVGLVNLDRRGFKWADGSDIVYKRWLEGYPHSDTDLGERHLCGTQDKRGWRNRHCDKKLPFVCGRKDGHTDPITPTDVPAVGGGCPDGYIGVEASNKCLRVVQLARAVAVTWKGAAAACRQALPPAYLPDLAAINTPLEQALVTTQIQTPSIGFWIGLHQTADAEAEDWFWLDNSATDFMNFASQSDKEGNCKQCCAQAVYGPQRAGSWVATGCDVQRGYVCQAIKTASAIVSTTINPAPKCAHNFTAYGEGCYKMIGHDMPIKWEAAAAICEDVGALLASIHSEAENAALTAAAIAMHTSVWIGVHQKKNGEWVWTDGWAMLYDRWGVGQPGSPTGNHSCVALSKDDGSWYARSCRDTLPGICKTTTAPPITTPAPVEGVCPGVEVGDTSWVEYGGYCYFVSDDIKTARAAQDDCKHRSQSANLVSIHHPAENAFVQSVFMKHAEYNHKSFWLGLYRAENDLAAGGSWRWRDGGALGYSSWAPEEPSKPYDCAEMYTTKGIYPFHWADMNCDNGRPFVCKSPKVPLTTTPPPAEGACPDPWVAFGAHCYRFLPDLHAYWHSALDECEALDSKASLVTVTSWAQNQFILKNMLERTSLPSILMENYWIGMYKDGPGVNEFKWISGAEYNRHRDFKNWAPRQPSDDGGQEDCVEVYVKESTDYYYEWEAGQWNDAPCQKNRAIVCQMPIVKKGMSGGATAGLVIGLLLFIIVMAVAVLYVLDKHGIVDVREKLGRALPFKNFSNENYDQEGSNGDVPRKT